MAPNAHGKRRPLKPWVPPGVANVIINPGHQQFATDLGIDPEASYYDWASNQMWAGNAWDETAQDFRPTQHMRPFTRAHEFGHAFDDQYLTDRDRERLRRIMHIKSSKPWMGNPEDRNQARPTPSEHFADWYASAARDINVPGSGRAKTDDYDTQYGGRRAWRRFRRLLDHVAIRNDLGRYAPEPPSTREQLLVTLAKQRVRKRPSAL
jgi:hypothetical protein